MQTHAGAPISFRPAHACPPSPAQSAQAPDAPPLPDWRELALLVRRLLLFQRLLQDCEPPAAWEQQAWAPPASEPEAVAAAGPADAERLPLQDGTLVVAADVRMGYSGRGGAGGSGDGQQAAQRVQEPVYVYAPHGRALWDPAAPCFLPVLGTLVGRAGGRGALWGALCQRGCVVGWGTQPVPC